MTGLVVNAELAVAGIGANVRVEHAVTRAEEFFEFLEAPGLVGLAWKNDGEVELNGGATSLCCASAGRMFDVVVVTVVVVTIVVVTIVVVTMVVVTVVVVVAAWAVFVRFRVRVPVSCVVVFVV